MAIRRIETPVDEETARKVAEVLSRSNIELVAATQARTYRYVERRKVWSTRTYLEVARSMEPGTIRVRIEAGTKMGQIKERCLEALEVLDEKKAEAYELFAKIIEEARAAAPNEVFIFLAPRQWDALEQLGRRNELTSILEGMARSRNLEFNVERKHKPCLYKGKGVMSRVELSFDAAEEEEA